MIPCERSGDTSPATWRIRTSRRTSPTRKRHTSSGAAPFGRLSREALRRIESAKKYQAQGINKTALMDQAYFTGSEKALEDIIQREFQEGTAEQKALLKRLLQDRNQTMTQRMNKLLTQKSQDRFFFAFGVAHFLGQDSVIVLLRKQGFTIKRLSAPPSHP